MTEESKKRYQRIIQDLGQIPTMPTIAAKVMQIVNDPHSSAEDVAKFISRDVALTSKVLRLANSAFYGIPRTISSVNSTARLNHFRLTASAIDCNCRVRSTFLIWSIPCAINRMSSSSRKSTSR